MLKLNFQYIDLNCHETTVDKIGRKELVDIIKIMAVKDGLQEFKLFESSNAKKPLKFY
jgi:hypothetical protein